MSIFKQLLLFSLILVKGFVGWWRFFYYHICDLLSFRGDASTLFWSRKELSIHQSILSCHGLGIVNMDTSRVLTTECNVWMDSKTSGSKILQIRT